MKKSQYHPRQNLGLHRASGAYEVIRDRTAGGRSVLGNSGGGEFVVHNTDGARRIELRGDATFRLVSELAARLPEQRVEELEDQFGSMDNVVQQLLIALPTKNTLDQKVGPFRDTANLVKFLGVRNRQTLDERVKAGTVLCVRSGDNQLMYPAFQFDEHRQGLPRLQEILDAFHADRKNAWDAALWLAQPDQDLDGRTPAAALRTEDADFVVELARRAGGVLAA